MRAQLIAGLFAVASSTPLQSHALFPARQVVQTMGPQAWVTLKAINGRDDVSEFLVEVYEPEGWVPSRVAVATPDRITVPAARKGAAAVVRNIRVLVQLRGAAERQVLVCTRSIPRVAYQSQMSVNTRVCARVTVKAWS